MSAELEHLKRMVSEGRYEIADDVLAAAIIDWIAPRRPACTACPEAKSMVIRVRSFHRDPHVQSFRLARTRVASARF